jgi:uncharacterized membrane protein YdbT with pleckstrin-like domain
MSIWNKIISPGEEVKFEFSLGKRYICLAKVFFCGLGIPLLFFYGLGVIPIFFGFFWAWYLGRSNNYAFTNRRILVLKGWLSTNLTSIDYDKITDVRVEQSFFDKAIFKTGNLIINTAGTPFPEIILTFIENPYEIKQKLDEIREKFKIF